MGAFEVFVEGCPKRLDVLPAVLELGKVQPGWDFDGSVILLWYPFLEPARSSIVIGMEPTIPASAIGGVLLELLSTNASHWVLILAQTMRREPHVTFRRAWRRSRTASPQCASISWAEEHHWAYSM